MMPAWANAHLKKQLFLVHQHAPYLLLLGNCKYQWAFSTEVQCNFDSTFRWTCSPTTRLTYMYIYIYIQCMKTTGNVNRRTKTYRVFDKNLSTLYVGQVTSYGVVFDTDGYNFKPVTRSAF